MSIFLTSFTPRVIPLTWRLLPVGKVLLDSQYGTNEPAVEDGNTRVIGMKDIQDGKIKTDNLSRSNLPDEDRKRFLLNRGDILINRTNSYDLVGKVGIFCSEDEVAFASYLVRLIADRSQVLPEYLNYWLNSYIAQKTIKRIATRAISQANINPTEFKKHCLIPLPPLSEQTAIADLLSTWDQAIEKTERLIAVKEKRFRWLIHNLIYGKDKKSGWRKMKLGEIFSERIETHRNDLPLLSITRDEGVILRECVDRKDTSNEDKSKYRRICPGDLGYNTMRMWQGVSGLSSLEGIVSPAYTICTPSRDVDGEFMAYLFKTTFMIHQFYRYSQGLTSDTWNLKYHHFKEIKVLIPPLHQQKQIASILNTARQEIDLLKKQAEAYRKQKRGLMQKLLTGTWRVNADAVSKEGAL